MITIPKLFPLLKDNSNINEGLSEDFINKIGKCKHPNIICI